MSQALAWPDLTTYLTPARARLVRVDLDTDREFARLDAPRPAAPAAVDELDQAHTATAPPRQALPCSVCGAVPARRYMNAWLCPACAPVVPAPDPERTAIALAHRRVLTLRAIAGQRE